LRLIRSMESYVLLDERWLHRLRGIELSDELLEELVLALAEVPVLEVGREELEEMRRLVGLWREGYAVPFPALVELLGRAEAERALEEARAVIEGRELMAEPDANLEVAREFCGLVDAERVLDVGSGFGWVPVLLSWRAEVVALDSAYSRRVMVEEGCLRVEGTNIVLSPWVRMLGEVRCYGDFAALFWKMHGARMERISLRCADATRLEELFVDDKPECATAFFSFNHMREWRSVLRSLAGVVEVVYAAIYAEHLQWFPVKGSYGWMEGLGVRAVELEEMLQTAEAMGFDAEVIEGSCRHLAEFAVLHR